jgi:DNA end-binding protein Ku
MAARAIGSGTVSFGLVSIPVKVYSANETSSSVRFSMVHKTCGTKVKQQYMCPTDEEVVPRSDIGKGYEFAKGQYVMVSEEEYKALQELASNAIELCEFVPAESVDPMFYEKTYFLGPDKGGERAYKLLSTAMTKTGLIGVAKYSARGKMYLVCVRPMGDNGLAMHQLRFADELRSMDQIPIGDAPDATEAELNLAIQIIEQITKNEFEPEQYKDEVKARMLDLIQQKIDGEDITASPEVAPQAQVIDLMEALKASLGEAKPAKGKKTTARKPAKKAATTKTKAKSTTAKKKKASK